VCSSDLADKKSGNLHMCACFLMYRLFLLAGYLFIYFILFILSEN